MSTNFFSLPRELRDQIYELVLVHEELIDPCAYHDPRQKSLGLLPVNKAVHREASSLFYSQNRFDFTMRMCEEVASFLGQIGRNNAAYIRHLCIDFPEFLYQDSGDVTIADDSVGILTKIQSACVNLSTLTTSAESTNAMEIRLDALDNPKVVNEALKLVNTHFGAISSLQEIIVKVYEDGPSDYIRRNMESHGWIISIAPREDFDLSFSDPERDDWDYDDRSDDDGEYDEHDFDSDSDFWRRAAD